MTSLKKGKLPNLTELGIFGKDQYSVTLLDEFDPLKTAKLEKRTLQSFIITTEELEILSEKLTAIQFRVLDISQNSGVTGSLSALFTHSLPTLNVLILSDCELNSNDLQSIARASVEGKLPQLRHLDILDNGNVEISDLFTHSAQWNDLKTLGASDGNILNVDTDCLTSLKALQLHKEFLYGPKLQSVTRRWSHLEVIWVDTENTARCIADGVERGMFPVLATVRCQPFDYGRPFFFKLLKANISVELS